MHALSGGRGRASANPAAPLAVVVALLAALAGGLVWAAVAYVTGYEVGYVAWAVGGLVGFATVRAGGRGTALAGIAAALTIFGIGVGKLLGTHFVVEQEVARACEEAFSREFFRELRQDAELYFALGESPSGEELHRFLFERGYAPSEDPGAVSEEDLELFESYNVPELRALSAGLSFEEWFAKRSAEARADFAREFSLLGSIAEELTPLDLVFALLAVSTAFGMIRRAGETRAALPPEQSEERSRAA